MSIQRMGYTAGTYQLRIDTGDSINTNSANIAKEVTDIGQSMDKYKSEINFAACRCSVGLFVESFTRKVNIAKAT
jgi:hypothetical protein